MGKIHPKQKSFKVAWGKLRAQVWEGPKHKTTVIALHGWLDNSNSFRPLLENFPPKAHWICLDMAGHGKSDWRPAGMLYHFFDYLQDLCDVVESSGVPQVHLVGHSLGAGVAAFFAAAFPDKVLSLTCLDALGPLPFAEQDLPRHYKEFRREWDALRQQGRKKRTLQTFSRAVSARLMAGTLSLPAAELLVDRNLQSSGRGFTWTTDPRLKLPSAYRVSEEQVRAFLRNIRCETHVIEAELGILTMAPYRQKRMECISKLKVTPVEGGHHVHMDMPELVAPCLNF